MTDTYERLMRPEASRNRLAAPPIAATAGGHWELVLVALGLLALFVPTYWDLARDSWTNTQEAHGPFVLAIVLGVAVARWRSFLAARGGAPIAGVISLVFGLLLYVIGRSQELLVLETLSQIPLLLGAIVALKGWQGLRALWFPVVFLGFTIVWPGWAIDALTIPLKQAATGLTVGVLGNFDYPITATGVIIMIGPYQLLVADACSGLNTIISLCSVGVLYLYMMRRPGWAWNAAIILALPFVAFATNVLRIASLTLITYHLGDRAGQSFLHGFTGLFLFAVALGLVFILDAAIERTVHLTRWLIAGRAAGK